MGAAVNTRSIHRLYGADQRLPTIRHNRDFTGQPVLLIFGNDLTSAKGSVPNGTVARRNVWCRSHLWSCSLASRTARGNLPQQCSAATVEVEIGVEGRGEEHPCREDVPARPGETQKKCPQDKPAKASGSVDASQADDRDESLDQPRTEHRPPDERLASRGPRRRGRTQSRTASFEKGTLEET